MKTKIFEHNIDFVFSNYFTSFENVLSKSYENFVRIDIDKLRGLLKIVFILKQIQIE